MTFYEITSFILLITGAVLIYSKKAVLLGWLCLPLYLGVQALAIHDGEQDPRGLLVFLLIWTGVFIASKRREVAASKAKK